MPQTSIGTTVPTPPLNTVDFLGLELSSHDAEVALNVIFAFLLTSVLGVVFVVFWLLKMKRKLKTAPATSLKMERM